MNEIVRNMLRRKGRTALTAFGIAIGVFALTVLGAMSEYFNTVVASAERLSASTIEVQPASTAGGGPKAVFSTTTIQQLERIPGVRDVANVITVPIDASTMSLSSPEQVYAVDSRLVRDVIGFVPLQSGRWIDESDVRATVVGSKLAASRGLGVGSTLTWKDGDYLVVGVMSDTGSFPDSFAVMPFETARRALKYPATYVGSLRVIPSSSADAETVAAAITADVPGASAKSPRQAIAESRSTMALFTAVMLGGAIMAAIVGGLAVVNTMVMSVSERTREIGVKKALGAENGTIVREFLAESAMIGLAGGAAGLWAGWVLATLLNHTIGGAIGGDLWLVTARLSALVLAFALVLGAGAGIYPAWFAARLRPVQALRAE